MPPLAVPTTAPLPSTLRVDPSNPFVLKILSRLSRSSLLAVTQDWLQHGNSSLSGPYLRKRRNRRSDITSNDNDDDGNDDDDGLQDDDGDGDDNNDSSSDNNGDSSDLYPPMRHVPALRAHYADLQTRKGTRKELVDRIVEGDWRHGLSLYQIAMADLQYLLDHPTSQRWTAYRIVPQKIVPGADPEDDPAAAVADIESLVVPRFHPPTFLRSLQDQALPDVKVHYQFCQHPELPLLLLRVFVIESPYNTALGPDAASARNFDTSRTVYIAFPGASPHIYISKPQVQTSAAAGAAAAAAAPRGGAESKSLQTLLAQGIPKALSRPRQRFGLAPTGLTTKNLEELLERRGPGRTNCAAGGWRIYADEMGPGGKKESPLDTVLPTPPLSEGDGEEDGVSSGSNSSNSRSVGRTKRAASPATEQEERAAKRARLDARRRFADSATMGDGKGIERLDVVIEDAFPGRGEGDVVDASRDARREWRPCVKVIFQGPHVFAGIRQLVEHGIVDGRRMPGWMTGEEGVTSGRVQDGRIKGHRGSGV